MEVFKIILAFLIELNLSAFVFTENSFIRCHFPSSPLTPDCQLLIFNPNGRDDFEEIEGQLPPGMTNNDVVTVIIQDQNTSNFPSIICRQFQNLHKIIVHNSRLSTIESTALDNCLNLNNLEIRNNEVSQLPDGVFKNLNKLSELLLTHNGINVISSENFIGLGSLNVLSLAQNNLLEVPHNAFSNLSTLVSLNLNGNNITKLESRSFGRSLERLVEFSASHNPINEIEALWFEDARRLAGMNLIGSLCADEFFSNIQIRRDEVRDRLQNCFENFVDGRFIRCEYFGTIEVSCNMNVFDPNGRDDFEEIEGNLPSGTTDHNVMSVTISEQNTKIIPSIICYTFPNLREISAIKSQIRILSQKSFENCKNLVKLEINSNEIISVIDDTFRSLEHLSELYLMSNGIRGISPQSFNGLNRLETLNLDGNLIAEIPHGSFDNLASVKVISMESNRLEVIDSQSFGRSLRTLEVFNGNWNRIDDFDETWLEDAGKLKILQLDHNLCISGTFQNVQNDREFVRNQLQVCIENFNIEIPPLTFIYCFYEFRLSDYRCSLQIQNPLGFDRFQNIPSTHLPSHENNDVTTVTAVDQNSRIIPAIICHQFPNLRSLQLTRSNIHTITARAFQNCDNLKVLSLISNYLVHIPSQVLPKSLNSINLDENVITEIDEDAFDDINVFWLRLSNNQLTYINPKWFRSSANVITSIDFRNNSISSIPPGTFVNLTRLTHIDVVYNILTTLESSAFPGSLSNIDRFYATNNKISSMDPEFFEQAARIKHFNLYGNDCISEIFAIDGLWVTREDVRQRLQICFRNFN